MMLNRQVYVHIPMVPNFIACGEDKQEYVPISDFTDEELRQIGEQYVLNLILLAQKRRKIKTASSKH